MPETTSERSEISQLLGRWRGGDEAARDRVFALVYGELRRRARWQLRRLEGVTLSPTTLVHETFLKLVDRAQVAWTDRSHFFAVASMAMRQILVDHARRRMARKRGQGVTPALLDETVLRLDERAAELVALDSALERLRYLDERLGRVVDLLFFGGLSCEEAADVLGLSPRTVKREWRKARAFLFHALGGEATT